jgi:hypothetical protein
MGTFRPARSYQKKTGVWDIPRQARNPRALLCVSQFPPHRQALASSIAINQGLEAERDELLRRVAKVEETCSDLRLQLRQVGRLEAELARALEVAEQRRAQCDAAAQEAFAQSRVNEELRCHGRQLLEQLSRRQPRPRSVQKLS